MADYGSNNDRGYNLLLRVEETGTSTANNTSTVRVQLWLRNGQTTFGMYNCSASVSIDGQTLSWSGRPDMYSMNSSLHLIDKTITIAHNSNGQKTIGFSATFSGSGGWSPGTLNTGYQSLRLRDIPRSSTASVSGNMMGSPITISITRASGDFTHKVTWQFGSLSGVVATGATTSCSWTPEVAKLAPQIPNATSGIGTILVQTIYGGKVIGESRIQVTLQLPSSVVPSLSSISLSDLNTIAQNAITGNTFVSLESNPKVTFNGATGIYGSTIPASGYRAEVFKFEGNSWIQLQNVATAQNGGVGGINHVGRAKISAFVTDSRGRQSPRKEVEISLLEYFKPILSFTSVRVGTAMNQLNVIRKVKTAPLIVGNSQKNRATMTWDILDLSTGTKTTNVGGAANWSTTTEHTKENFQATLNGSYDQTKSYTIIGHLRDLFYETDFEFTVGPEKVVYGLSPTGMGIGKAWTRGVLDVDGSQPSYFDGDIIMRNKKLIDIFYPVGTIYESTSYANPSTFMGGKWERFGNGHVLVGVSETESEFNTVSKTGGSKTHTLTINEMPVHSHPQYVSANSGNQAIRRDYSSDGGASLYPQGNNTGNSGGGQAHNNLQPYITVYRWRRTA
ncbi:TPA: DUF859 family phage minor structural protein [Streptococcus agalactiae]